MSMEWKRETAGFWKLSPALRCASTPVPAGLTHTLIISAPGSLRTEEPGGGAVGQEIAGRGR